MADLYLSLRATADVNAADGTIVHVAKGGKLPALRQGEEARLREAGVVLLRTEPVRPIEDGFTEAYDVTSTAAVALNANPDPEPSRSRTRTLDLPPEAGK